jgi:cell division protein FtsI/penicillin-binding protein 2
MLVGLTLREEKNDRTAGKEYVEGGLTQLLHGSNEYFIVLVADKGTVFS